MQKLGPSPQLLSPLLLPYIVVTAPVDPRYQKWNGFVGLQINSYDLHVYKNVSMLRHFC